MKKYNTPEELLELDLELDKMASDHFDSDSMMARAEIIPLVSKEDEAFLLHEDSVADEIPLLPLRNTVLFPGVVMPIALARQSSLQLARVAEQKNMTIVVVAQSNDTETPQIDDMYQYGVVARVLRVINLPQDNCMAILQGTMKCHLDSITRTTPTITATSPLSTKTSSPNTPASSTTWHVTYGNAMPNYNKRNPIRA